MSISTKTGDQGQTSLMFGKRVSKNHPRVRSYGAVDELSAALGLARARVKDKQIKQLIHSIQQQLISLMSELATDASDLPRLSSSSTALLERAATQTLESHIARLEAELPATRGWILGGECLSQAQFDMARAICRRAERECVGLAESGEPVRPEIVVYLNRLSDLLWLLGKQAFHRFQDG